MQIVLELQLKYLVFHMKYFKYFSYIYTHKKLKVISNYYDFRIDYKFI